MAIRVGINGFGRVGRQVMKIVSDNYAGEIEIVAVNSMRSPATLAHLLKYDSTYGIYKRRIESDDRHLVLNGKAIRVISGDEPSRIPWEQVGAQIVIEATGKFRQAAQCFGHLQHGVEKVIISAPGKGVDLSVVPGVNEDDFDPNVHNIVSCASCTTNCLAPVAKVLNDAFGIRRAFVSTVHSYTTSQSLQDGKNKDLRRSRSALWNIIPSSTGATKAIGEVIPELRGRMSGNALRVPVPTVSVLDLTADLEESRITSEDVNHAFRKAAAGALRGILDVCDEELVSVDFKGTSYSAVVDSAATIAHMGLVKVLAWYDNEWSYSCRVADLLAHVAGRTFAVSEARARAEHPYLEKS